VSAGALGRQGTKAAAAAVCPLWPPTCVSLFNSAPALLNRLLEKASKRPSMRHSSAKPARRQCVVSLSGVFCGHPAVATHRLQRPRRWCASPHPPPAAGCRAARHALALAPRGLPRADPAARQALSPCSPPSSGEQASKLYPPRRVGVSPGPAKGVRSGRRAPPHNGLLWDGWMAQFATRVTSRAVTMNAMTWE